MTYAIVTNTFRRPLDMVVRNLRASLSQMPRPSAVILIDQNPQPLKLPPDISNNPLLRVQNCHFSAVSAARNTLEIPPGTDWICFCDDDGYLVDDYAKKFFARVQSSPELEVIAGSIRRNDTQGFYSLRHAIGGSMEKFTNHKLLMGSNFCVRREIFDGLGRFDDRFGAGALWGSGEESDFALNCFFHKKKMIYAPELVVFHAPPFNEDIRRGFAKSYKYGLGKGALVAKWLFSKGQPLMLLELSEMLVVPFFQVIRGLFALKFGLIINNVGTLAGRILGLVIYPFRSHAKKAQVS